MTPVTLARTAEMARSGTPRRLAQAAFLDAFYLAADAESRWRMIEDEPAREADPRQDAWHAAVADHLARSWLLALGPDWTRQSARRLERPWFPGSEAAPDLLREYLATVSPPSFRMRGIFVDAVPLRRATMARARPTPWRDPGGPDSGAAEPLFAL